MDSTTTSLDFAIIGHQESWLNIAKFFNGIRIGQSDMITIDKIKPLFSSIPPRDICYIKMYSVNSKEINGVYIETFIDPDKLDAAHVKTNVNKVIQAISRANKMGAKIVTLGGFTSLVLEGKLDSFDGMTTKFTTGNTLTAAFIVKGIEAAIALNKKQLSESKLLVIGATGDIGMGCTQYFKSKVHQLLLTARNQHRLEKYANSLKTEGRSVQYSTNLNELVPQADIILSVASSSGILLNNCKENALICDAGYPKNLVPSSENGQKHFLFHGGMGHLPGGFKLYPDYSEHMFRYPATNALHGCVSEALVLAFEEKYESFSAGKGMITVECMEEIYELSIKHGITLAPFYNNQGLW